MLQKHFYNNFVTREVIQTRKMDYHYISVPKINFRHWKCTQLCNEDAVVSKFSSILLLMNIKELTMYPIVILTLLTAFKINCMINRTKN